jgi:ABC-2 type transport system permease protein
MNIPTTTLAQPRMEWAAKKKMHFNRVLLSYLTEAKYESLRMLRMPGFSAPLLILPVALFLLFGVAIFGAMRHDAKAVNYLFTGFAVFGMVGPGMFGFGVILAIERETGLLKLKRALPMPPASYLLAKMAMCLLYATIVMATMIVAARLATLLPMTVNQIMAVSALSILGTLPFCAIGLLVSTIVRAQSATGMINLLYFPMLYLSGIFYRLPKFLQTFAPIWPTYHLHQLMLNAIHAPYSGSPIFHAGLLIVLTVVCFTLAVRRLTIMG